MGYRFPKIRPSNGEIVEPDDLNENFKQFTDELNGNLSRENLKINDSSQKLKPHQFKNETFCEVFESSIFATADWASGRAALIPSRNTTGYTSVGTEGKEMPSVEFVAERDGWVIIDFNASHMWKGTGLLSLSEAERKLLIKRHWPVQHYDRLAMHNSSLPVGGWIGLTCRDGESRGLEASKIITHMDSGDDVSLYYRDFPQGKYILQPVDRFGIKYRVTLNGSEICETGWQYNGKDRNGCYTCGVIPVRAGRNIIKSEVAVANVENLWGTSQGVRAEAGDSGAKKGKYFPKTFVSSEDTLSVLPELKQETFTVDDATAEYFDEDMQSSGETTYTIILGIECWIGAANLVVQYRKG